MEMKDIKNFLYNLAKQMDTPIRSIKVNGHVWHIYIEHPRVDYLEDIIIDEYGSTALKSIDVLGHENGASVVEIVWEPSFISYLNSPSMKFQESETDLDSGVPDVEELQRLLRKLLQKLNWHRELFDRVRELAISAVKSATRDEPKETLEEKAIELFYATIDLEEAHNECRNVLKTTESADELYDYLKKFYKS